jgi:SAM-dependent methyltransferase
MSSDSPAVQEDVGQVAAFMAAAIRQLGGFAVPSRTPVLDFGCGQGHLVHALSRLGYDVRGCDIPAAWAGAEPPASRGLSAIALDPYRLPFDARTFDVVISTSVLEHAQNKAECFREIHRVLKPGGTAMHIYPGKWYLPCEPHIFVPLVNFLWPDCPKWWLGLWAMLGVRNAFQRGQSWRAVAEMNFRYCREGLSYWSTRQYKELSLQVFGNCRWPMRFYLDHAHGGSARLFKQLPCKALSGRLSKEVRMGFMVQQKAMEGAPAAAKARGREFSVTSEGPDGS